MIFWISQYIIFLKICTKLPLLNQNATGIGAHHLFTPCIFEIFLTFTLSVQRTNRNAGYRIMQTFFTVACLCSLNYFSSHRAFCSGNCESPRLLAYHYGERKQLIRKLNVAYLGLMNNAYHIGSDLLTCTHYRRRDAETPQCHANLLCIIIILSPR